MNQPIPKSSLTAKQCGLVRIFQQYPHSRVEGLYVHDGEPSFERPPRVVQRLKMGADNTARPEVALPDFWLKRQMVDLLGLIAELGEGEIKSIEIAHGLPVLVEIERRPVFAGESTHA